MSSVDLVVGGAGDYSISVYVAIASNGDLHVTRLSSGRGASQSGADESEYIAAIDEGDKDRLLLALLEAQYGGNDKAQDEIAKFAEGKGIDVQRFRWP